MSLPKVFRNNNTGVVKNNIEQYYSKEDNLKTNLELSNDNMKPIIIKKKINDIFNSGTFIYKVNVIITTLDGDKECTLIARNNDSLLTLNNEKILISDILDIKKI